MEVFSQLETTEEQQTYTSKESFEVQNGVKKIQTAAYNAGVRYTKKTEYCCINIFLYGAIL